MNPFRPLRSAIGVLAALCLPVTADVTTVFNDWDATQTVAFTATGGSTATTGEFWSLPGNSQLKVTSGTNGGFGQFLKTASLPRNSAFLTALSTGTSLRLDYRSFAADNTLNASPAYRLRLIVNTDAGGLGYAGAASPVITINAAATTDANGTLIWTYSTNTAFVNAINAYRSNTGSAGTFFEFYIDNSGAPAQTAAAVFSIDNLRVISPDVVIPEIAVFNNFDTIQTVPFSASGGVTVTTGEFWSLPGDKQFKITSPVAANFTALAKTALLPRESAFLTALTTGTSLNLDYRSFAADNTLSGSPSYRFRLVVNTDAGGLGYGGASSPIISINAAATSNSNGTLVWNYSENATFMAALNAYRTNTGTAGTFFEFSIDNTGFPGLASAAVFSIDNFRVISPATSTGTFSQWLTDNAPATGFSTDSDQDGIPNGVENVFGSNPNTFSPGLTQISATGNSATFTHPLNASIASDVTYSYEWSTDLIEWKVTNQPNTAGITAIISASGSGPVTVTTTASQPTGRLFTRVVANQAP